MSPSDSAPLGSPATNEADHAPIVRKARRAHAATSGIKTRFPSRLIALGLLVILVILGVATGLALISARDSMNDGLREVQRVEADLQGGLVGRTPLAALRQTKLHLRAAHVDFQAADNRLSVFGPLLRHLSWLPRIGAEVAAAPDVADVASETTGGGLSLLAGLDPLTAEFGGDRAAKQVPVQVLVARLARGRSSFDRACVSLQSAQRTRRLLHGHYSATLSSALGTFDRQVPRLVVLCHALALAPELLGYPRPHTYLLAYQNSDELRATGGFIGSAGILTLRNGSVIQHFLGTNILDNLSIPPPEPVSLYNGEPGWLFRDSNWSPDFPTSAALERYFARLDLHQTAQGVVDITPRAASELLAATGSFYSPEYRRWITAGNVAYLADYYAHWASSSGPGRYRNADTQRKQFIAIVAQHVFSLLRTMSPGRLFRLTSSISSGIAHRDILVNFSAPQEQALARLAGASGEINPTISDYLYVVDTNLSYNKINPYVHFSGTYEVHVRSNRWLQSTLTLHFKNVPAPPRVANYGLGPGAGTLGSPDDYADFVRIYVPAGAALIDQSGWTQRWSPGPAYGKTMFSGYLIVRRGQARTVRLEYVVPPNVFTWSRGRTYRLFIQHQPGSRPDSFGVSVAHDGQPRFTWTLAHPSADWTRTVPVTPLPFQPVPLTVGPSSIVAPGHWIEPHAYLQAPKP